MVAAALAASSGCAAESQRSLERDASPTTWRTGATIEPIGIDAVDGPAGNGVTDDTVVVASDDTMFVVGSVPPTVPTVPSTSPPTVPSTLPPTVAPTVPPTGPPTISLTVPQTLPARTPAPATRAARVPVPRQSVPAAAPSTATSEIVAVPSPTASPTASPTTAPASKSVVVRADRTLAVLGAKCLRSQVGVQRRTKSGLTVVCTRTKATRYVWQSVVIPSTSPVVTPAVVQGFDGGTITLGVIGTTTNPTWSNISKAISAGFEARIAAINRRGGVGGRYPIKILYRDANYDPALTLVELAATQSSVVGYGSVLGTPATEAAVPFLRDNQLLASPASQEGRWAKEPNLLPVFNSYQIQAISGVSYFLEQSPGSTVCSVSIATSFGDAGAEGFAFAATDLGARVGASLLMAPADTNPAPVLAQLARGGCQGVVTTLAPQQLVQLVMGAARSGLAFRWIVLGAGFSDRIITPQTSKTFEATCWVIGDGPVWGEKETAPLAADLLAADNRYWTENPDVGLTFGYTQARVWEAILERAVAAGDLSRSGLLDAARTVGIVDTGGLGSPIDYSQPMRLSAPRASIYAVDGSYRNSIRLLNAVYTAPAAARFRLR